MKIFGAQVAVIRFIRNGVGYGTARPAHVSLAGMRYPVRIIVTDTDREMARQAFPSRSF